MTAFHFLMIAIGVICIIVSVRSEQRHLDR